MLDRNLSQLPGMRATLMALVVLALLQAACIIGQAFSLSSAVVGLWEASPVSEEMPYVVALAICFSLLQILRAIQETMLDRYSEAQAQVLERQLLERAFDQHSMLGLEVGATRLANSLTDGIDEIQAYLRIIPPKIVGMAAISVPIFICLLAGDWPSGVICGSMFPVIMFFMVLLGKQASARSERQYASYTRLTNRFMDTLHGLAVIKAFRATDREADSVYRHSESLRKATVRTLTTATLSSTVLDLFATFGVAAVAMMLAFRLLDGTIGLSTALFALVLAPEFFSPIRSFANDYHASLDGKNSLADAFALLSLGDRAPALTRIEAPQGKHRVELRDASFSYGANGAGVEHMTFRAQGPQKVAIIGKSGSGKSTLANMIAGFIDPTDGEIESGAVRYIPQKPYVFRATLEDNVRFYNPQATRDEVEAAIAAVGLGELVDSLPDGLETLVGEGARGLSGGEAHRVALARIMLDETAWVLVFDEPTAHLDIETELDLKGPMLSLMEGKLVFIATHRLHWLGDVDRVIELDGGRIVRDEVVA